MKDWTTSKTGHTNSSEKYNDIVDEVERLIYDSAHDIIHGNINQLSRLIVSQLAHKHNMVPYNPSLIRLVVCGFWCCVNYVKCLLYGHILDHYIGKRSLEYYGQCLVCGKRLKNKKEK